MKMLVGALLALALTVAVFGTIYVVAQQLERQGADDQPERLASEVAASPQSASRSFELTKRLDAFAIVVDAQGRPVDGDLRLHGRRIDPPTGVIAVAQKDGRDHLTWQPASGLRFALVAARDGDRTVVAGEALAPTERRIDEVGLLVAVAGLGTAALAITGVYVSGAWAAAFRGR